MFQQIFQFDIRWSRQFIHPIGRSTLQKGHPKKAGHIVTWRWRSELHSPTKPTQKKDGQSQLTSNLDTTFKRKHQPKKLLSNKSLETSPSFRQTPIKPPVVVDDAWKIFITRSIWRSELQQKVLWLFANTLNMIPGIRIYTATEGTFHVFDTKNPGVDGCCYLICQKVWEKIQQKMLLVISPKGQHCNKQIIAGLHHIFVDPWSCEKKTQCIKSYIPPGFCTDKKNGVKSSFGHFIIGILIMVYYNPHITG